MIYVLEDDASIQKLVVYTLNSQGMEARGFDRPSQFWSALALEKPELVLLDIMLPEEDGLQVLKKLRADPATRRTPVLMLTAKSTEYDKVLGLDQGADDYIAKPFGMMELMARIRQLLSAAGTYNGLGTVNVSDVMVLFGAACVIYFVINFTLSCIVRSMQAWRKKALVFAPAKAA